MDYKFKHKIMISLKNSVRLIGFLGNTPDITKFGENKSLARASIATNVSYKNRDGDWVSDTQWHNLVMWGRHAVFAEKSLDKGSEIAIEGKLVNRTYTDKEGVVRYLTEVVVNEIITFTRKEKVF
jgi:single-strand DNA-binding protein